MPTKAEMKDLKTELHKRTFRNLAKLVEDPFFDAFKGISAGSRPVFWEAAKIATFQLDLAETFRDKAWESDVMWRSEFANKLCRNVGVDFDYNALFSFDKVRCLAEL